MVIYRDVRRSVEQHPHRAWDPKPFEESRPSKQVQDHNKGLHNPGEEHVDDQPDLHSNINLEIVITDPGAVLTAAASGQWAIDAIPSPIGG